jgi:hypothetical protein
VRTLLALGYRSDEIVCTAANPPGGNFMTQLDTVRGYHQAGFAPPPDMDVYFGVNPLRPDLCHGRRGSEADVTRVVALFADLDIKDGGFNSLAACRRVVAELSVILGIEPAVVVESGHGLQPFWRIANTSNVPNEIRDLADRQEWKVMIRRWGGLVHEVAATVQPGVRIDPVFDLARILRCPGSVNNKNELQPVEVKTWINNNQPDALTRRRIERILDQRNARPFGGPVASIVERIPSTAPEVQEWIDDRPGSNALVPEMLERMREPGYRSMVHCLDHDGLVKLFRWGSANESSAHALMVKRVQHVVYLSTEQQAGLKLALEFIKQAYLEVMEMRRNGIALGVPRSETEAVNDFERAVRGAVERARSRGTGGGSQPFRYRVEKTVSGA